MTPTILVLVPGRTIHRGTAAGLLALQASRYQVVCEIEDAPGFHFDHLWADALNAAESGKITHVAMCHGDIEPLGLWVDVLMDEMTAAGVDLISAVVPIKDARGVTSCGIGDPRDRWQPWRRFTMREVFEMPETFNAADAGYAGLPLIHNDGLMLADLRCQAFHATGEDGAAKIHFKFDTRLVKTADGWREQHESEDWYFSRLCWENGVRSAITRKVQLLHHGTTCWGNEQPWGRYENGDEDTAAKWRNQQPGEAAA